ncbi:MAG TPA: nitroreductase family protein [Nitrospira sp.]|nr:nitroreductase family protein [Nitrospira sp.]
MERDKVLSLLEAARWAPSSNNEQPWRFLVATKEEPSDYERFFEGNRQWVFRAPVLMLSVAAWYFRGDDKPNRHALHDTGLAAETLVLQAVALGVVAHQMAGFDVDKARANCAISPGFEPVAMIALGYPGDPPVLPDYLRERELSPGNAIRPRHCSSPRNGAVARCCSAGREPARRHVMYGGALSTPPHLLGCGEAMEAVPDCRCLVFGGTLTGSHACR